MKFGLPSFSHAFESKDPVSSEFTKIANGYFEGSPIIEKDVLEFIENNNVEDYVQRKGINDPRKLEAIGCLSRIYDELEKDPVDKDAVAELTSQLMELTPLN